MSQVSTTVETFQDLSLPIPGKEDLAKLHSSIHQNLPVKTGTCPDSYNSQGWISYIMESIRRSVSHVFRREVEINIWIVKVLPFSKNKLGVIVVRRLCKSQLISD